MSTERDNDNGNTSRLSVLQFNGSDLSLTGASLVPTREWDLTPDLPNLANVPGGSNLGLEAVTWIPTAS